MAMHPDWEIGDIAYDPDVGVPLAAATIWPDEPPKPIELPSGRVVYALPPGRSDAEGIERRANQRLGFVACPGDHLRNNPCPDCGAAL